MIIRLLGIKVFAYHGAYPHEQENGANFEIDVEFTADLSKAVATDDLESTIDYASVYQMTYVLSTNKKYKLIETLADTIAKQLLSTFAVSDVLVRVRKPEAEVGGPIGTVEVECRLTSQMCHPEHPRSESCDQRSKTPEGSNPSHGSLPTDRVDSSLRSA